MKREKVDSIIYISTGGFSDQKASLTCSQLLSIGINQIELSGGLFDSNQLGALKALKNRADFQVHNYFPPPKEPFVLNLASQNEIISRLSFHHVQNSIQLACELGSSFYSVHGGFLFDPGVHEMGSAMANKPLYERSFSLDLFIERISKLASFAKDLGIELLIENNVLTEINHKEFGTNPLLMTTSDECKYIAENTPSNVNLLVDLAHLKVSSKTLGFEKISFLEECNQWIKAYHISDNDSFSDSNQIITTESWFWPYLRKDLEYYTLEIYKIPLIEFLSQKSLLASFLIS